MHAHQDVRTPNRGVDDILSVPTGFHDNRWSRSPRGLSLTLPPISAGGQRSADLPASCKCSAGPGLSPHRMQAYRHRQSVLTADRKCWMGASVVDPL